MGSKARLLVTVIAAAASARLGLHEWTDDYKMDRDWVVRCVAVLAVLAILEPVAVILRRRAEPLSPSERAILDNLMKAALVQVVDYCNGDYRRMAINIYAVRRTLRHPHRGEQVKVGRLRLAASPAPSTIRWTKGKGFIGMIWAQKRELVIDIGALYYLVPADCDQKAWMNQPDSVRLGLSHAEFLQVQDYAVIVGAPIIRDGKYLGCVTMDAPDRYGDRIRHPTVTGALQVLANTVSTWL